MLAWHQGVHYLQRTVPSFVIYKKNAVLYGVNKKKTILEYDGTK